MAQQEIEYFMAVPLDGKGHCKLNEFGWHGHLALNEKRHRQYREAVSVRDRFGLKAAGKYLEANGWKITWAWVGVHGD